MYNIIFQCNTQIIILEISFLSDCHILPNPLLWTTRLQIYKKTISGIQILKYSNILSSIFVLYKQVDEFIFNTTTMPLVFVIK